MGQVVAEDMDAWLRDGGVVVTASERAARAVVAGFHRAREAEGLAAWPAPAIEPWNSFVLNAWQERVADGRLVLNPAQEELVWAEIIGRHAQSANLLEEPRHRAARMAMEAHALLCAYAPQLLQATTRSAWQQDAAAFSAWLTQFDEACRAGNFVSPVRLPLELISHFSISPSGDGEAARPPLLLAGFDRLQPIQRQFFDAWGECREVVPGAQAAEVHFYEAPNGPAELAACAMWCSSQLAAHPARRILVVTQEAAARRGEIERAFLRHVRGDSLFEFSLGVPLDQVPLARSAHLMLRWLDGSLAEHEVDWLFASGYAASPQESSALQGLMRAIRHRNREQPEWNLETFFKQKADDQPDVARWMDRIREAHLRLKEFGRRLRSPLEWSDFATQLLESIGWPAARALSSAEFQAASRFRQVVEDAGSLGFDGRRIPWKDFLAALARALAETVFTPQSRNAPIQIAGPAESAGLSADAIWFLGTSEEAWPTAASRHPFLPLEVQRRYAMPHASPQLDWELARAITERLLASAPEVHFSFARQVGSTESRASRLVVHVAGPPRPLPGDLMETAIAPARVEIIEDRSLIAFKPGRAEGGAAVLTAQSQCAFKAFAIYRLGAQRWEPAQPSLTAAQRGSLLHAVLHAIWGGPPEGMRNLEDLQKVKDLPSFVAGHVRRVFQQELRGDLRARMSPAYLEIEEQRLVRLICEWLNYEAARIRFEVIETEDRQVVPVGGLTLELRLDRIDRLIDGTLLVIDYKSGGVLPKAWELPRPDDVQLPLYAAFAIREGERIGGLTFAKVRAGDTEFAGRIGDAKATLMPGLSSSKGLVKNALTAEQLIDWRDCIEGLASDFLAGRADVDPREYPKTCADCSLQTLCRIEENRPATEADGNGDETESEEAVNE